MMDYNEINDDVQLDEIEFPEVQNLKTEFIFTENSLKTDNFYEYDQFPIDSNENTSDEKEKSKKIRKRKNSPIKCEICGIVCKSMNKYDRHKFNHFKTSILQCNECGKIFNRREGLISHIKLHHLNVKNEREECKICGKFVLQMNMHMQHHTNARFKCDICDKRFRSNSYYIEHYKTHLEIKEFRCMICERNFSRKSYLKYHMQKHERRNDGLYFQIKQRGVREPIKKTVENTKNRLGNIIERSVACDTSDLESNTMENCVVVFPVGRWEENRGGISPSNLSDGKWANALFSSQGVDTSDIDYFLDFLGRCAD